MFLAGFLLVMVVSHLHVQLCSGVDGEKKPGIRVVCMSKALDYLNGILVPLLRDKLLCKKFDDISGTYEKLKMNYNIKNLQVNSLDIKTSSLTSNQNEGITLRADNVSVATSADFNVSFNSLAATSQLFEFSQPFKIVRSLLSNLSFNGALTVSVSQLSFKIGIFIRADEQGQPLSDASSCDFQVGDLNINFTGNNSPFFNSWVPFIKDYLTKNLNKTVCKLITDQLADFDKTVSSIPLVIPIGDVANLSYKLIGQPQFTSQHIMASVEGEFLSSTQPYVDPHLTPTTLPPVPPVMKSGNSRMVYLWVTDYVANTAALVYMRAGYLRYNVTADMLKDKGPFLRLDTTTFSLLVPELYHSFPRKNLTLTIRALERPPVVNITEKGADFTINGAVDFYVCDVYDHGKKQMPLAFTLGVRVIVNAAIWLGNDTANFKEGEDVRCSNLSIKAKATYINITWHQLSSNIGDVDTDKINDLARFLKLVDTVILPMVNKVADKGFPLPDPIKGLTFVNPALKFGKGYVIVETDVDYEV